MTPDDYRKLTPGARMARRGTYSSRPWDKDFENACLTDICDYVACNPWVRSQFGGNLNVRVLMDTDKGELVLSFKRLPHGVSGS